MYQIRYCAVTDRGKVRAGNEDNYYADGKWRKDLRRDSSGIRGVKKDGTLLAAVCDGMGGEACGEVASLIAAKTLGLYDTDGGKGRSLRGREGQSLSEGGLSQRAEEYLAAANKRMEAKALHPGQIMGTTLAAVEIADDEVRVLNLGDSRTYRLHHKILGQVSWDDSMAAQMLLENRITTQAVRRHPLAHQITGYLGTWTEGFHPSITISDPILPEEGDRYLICSDGLTDMVKDEKIREILRMKRGTKEAAEALRDAALAAGGRDNVTVMLVDIVGENEAGEADWSTTQKAGEGKGRCRAFLARVKRKLVSHSKKRYNQTGTKTRKQVGGEGR